MTNEATRLAEEIKRLAREMRDIDPADCNASIPAEEAVDAVVDALAALAQPAVSEEAAPGRHDGTWSVFSSGGACIIENVTFDLAADYMTADRFTRGWNMVSCENITTMEQLTRAQLAAMASQEKPHD